MQNDSYLTLKKTVGNYNLIVTLALHNENAQPLVTITAEEILHERLIKARAVEVAQKNPRFLNEINALVESLKNCQLLTQDFKGLELRPTCDPRTTQTINYSNNGSRQQINRSVDGMEYYFELQRSLVPIRNSARQEAEKSNNTIRSLVEGTLKESHYHWDLRLSDKIGEFISTNLNPGTEKQVKTLLQAWEQRISPTLYRLAYKNASPSPNDLSFLVDNDIIPLIENHIKPSDIDEVSKAIQGILKIYVDKLQPNSIARA